MRELSSTGLTGVYSLGAEMLRNVESFWCPIRFYDGKKCDNCKLDFPDIERARLSNGIEIVYANRDAVPDIDVIGQCLREAIDELVDTASGARVRAPRGRKPAKGS